MVRKKNKWACSMFFLKQACARSAYERNAINALLQYEEGIESQKKNTFMAHIFVKDAGTN
jgi:hypothetical protein